MTSVEVGLAAIVIGLITGSGGAWLGSKSKVTSSLCKERREGCSRGISIELEHIKETLTEIRDRVKRIEERG